MASILRTAWDTLTELVFPSCVWGGHLGTPAAGSPSKPTRSARFRLDLEVLEPRMALAANPLIEPLVAAQPFVLGETPYADSELRSDAALGSSALTVLQQAQPDYRIESRNAAGLMVAVYGRDAGSDAFDLYAQRGGRFWFRGLPPISLKFRACDCPGYLALPVPSSARQNPYASAPQRRRTLGAGITARPSSTSLAGASLTTAQHLPRWPRPPSPRPIGPAASTTARSTPRSAQRAAWRGRRSPRPRAKLSSAAAKPASPTMRLRNPRPCMVVWRP